MLFSTRQYLCQSIKENILCRLLSDGQLRRRGLVQRLLVPGQLGRHLAVAVVLDDLGAVADEQLGVNQAVNVVPDGLAGDKR